LLAGRDAQATTEYLDEMKDPLKRTGLGPSVISAMVAVVLLAYLSSPVGAQTLTFDFDTSTPLLPVGINAPFSQTSGGITAQFVSPQGASYSIQTDNSTGYQMSRFSGHYLYPNNSQTNSLDIAFSQDVTNITFAFATTDFPPIEIPSLLQLTAYHNSTNTPVGSMTTNASYGSDTMPMGVLTFSSTSPFNLVTLRSAPNQLSSGFLLDNITVQLTGLNMYTVTISSSPSAGGSVSGGGIYTDGSSVTLTATPDVGCDFFNWTEAGMPVSASAEFSFTVNTDRTLVANFSPRLQIRLTSSNTAVVSWTTNASGFILQESKTGNSTEWAVNTNLVEVVQARNQAILSPLAAICLYRLQHP
jgi:hypothetical protein